MYLGLVVSSVTQTTGWYFMFTWDIAGVFCFLAYSGVSADIPCFTVLVLLFPSCLVSVSGCVEGSRSEGQSSWLVCLLVIHLEDLLLRTVGDVSSDAGDGLADCAHLGLAPLDVDLRVFWSTTSNPL